MRQGSTAPQVYDNRLEHRKNALIHAFVSDRAEISDLKCVIRDISKSGCRIASSYIDDLPRIIEIIPEGFDKPLTGKIVWRNSKVAGVEFLTPAEAAAFERQKPKIEHKAETSGFFGRLQSFAGLRRHSGRAARDETRAGHEPRDYGVRVLHGLRNPLAALKGLLNLLLGGTIRPIPKRARTIIKTAQKNAHKAETLVEEALQVKNIESGRLPCNPELMDIVELASDSLLTNTGHAAKYDVRFEMRDDVGEAMVKADPARMDDLLSILLVHAAKSSPAGATISLGLMRTGGAIRISVCDQGMGTDNAPDMADGMDAGFDICRAILEKHRSSLQVETRPGAGTTRWFELRETS